jgi:hypothetical protein
MKNLLLKTNKKYTPEEKLELHLIENLELDFINSLDNFGLQIVRNSDEFLILARNIGLSPSLFDDNEIRAIFNESVIPSVSSEPAIGFSLLSKQLILDRFEKITITGDINVYKDFGNLPNTFFYVNLNTLTIIKYNNYFTVSNQDADLLDFEDELNKDY